jgi:hypothetical protein
MFPENNFHSCTVHLGIIKSFIHPTECTIKLFQKNIKTYKKIYIKSAATCFGLTTIIRELCLTDQFNNYNFSKVQTVSSQMMVVRSKHVGAFLM